MPKTRSTNSVRKNTVSRSEAKDPIALAEAVREEGNLQEAADVLNREIASYPKRQRKGSFWLAELYCQLGETYQKVGDYAKAVEAYHSAETTTPDQPKTIAGIARCYQAMGMADEAIRLYERLCQLIPGWRDYYMWCIGFVNFEHQRWEQAYAAFQQVKDPSCVNQIHPAGLERVHVHYPMAIACQRLGHPAEAVDFLRRHTKEDHAEQWFELGVLLLKAEDFDTACSAFKEAEKVDRFRVDCWHNLGLTYLGTGDTPKAMQMVRRLKKWDPQAAESLEERLGGRDAKPAAQPIGETRQRRARKEK